MSTKFAGILGITSVVMMSMTGYAQWNVIQTQPGGAQQQQGTRPAYPHAQPLNNARAVPAFPYGQNRYVPPAQPQYVAPPPQVYPQHPQQYSQPWYYDSYGQDSYSGHYDERGTRHSENRQYASPKYPKQSVLVGEFVSGGEAKEVVVNRVISRCYLELVSGSVSINTVVVRPEKTKLPQTVRLVPGQLHMIDLGRKRAVTGFRISDGGRGVYRVIVQ